MQLLFGWIVAFLDRWEYVGVLVLTFLENVFPPLPSELILPLAGFATLRGRLDIGGTIAAASIGSLAGAACWYILARRIGEIRVMHWVETHGRWLTIRASDIARTQHWFERHDEWAVFLGRLVPAVRTFISIPAGFARMPAVPFAIFSALGTVLWTTALVLAGRFLGGQFTRVHQLLGRATWIVLGLIALVPVVRSISRRRGATGTPDPSRTRTPTPHAPVASSR
jgi:membrane protein DedA with SNARE-associated domain